MLCVLCGKPAEDETKVTKVTYLCCSDCGVVSKAIDLCDGCFEVVRDARESLSDGP